MLTRCPITVFGEVLFDSFPDGTEVLGGAPFNVAWHLQGFGLAPCFISRVGTDRRGEAIRSAMTSWGLETAFLQTDPSSPTGRVAVTFEDDEPHYEIVPGSAYDVIQSEGFSQLPASGLLYHGTLALRHSASASALAALKARHAGKIFLDVNLRSPWWSPESVLPLVDDADHVKLNAAELALLTSDVLAEANGASLVASMDRFARRHHLETLILTRGALGALVWRDGESVSVGPAACTHVVDTVGAGDGFAAAFLLGLCQQWPLVESLEHARDFAGALVSRRGATIDDLSVYEQFLTSWSSS
ncbi:PfkB family carbohydrate kinase [Synechococcus sp. BA-132 BA5]|uniref:PfkB family carbohydrate kinase n=1 Tax=Synechococcus sp. BA-132 BA5 TaxID=3110252 RepID=UPI002B20EB66|nr:PfkB family carbohydrate kinase [Synechococcus sp. BA-132 BA5]MEA5413519.1 PfkB family carbohydrate kinase [Synechococcus sp. BA-132 BA5]